ncbi:DUF4870 domain-containing protein [Amphibacillus cookii]|uniref:DUF4870 domain-containing protein n=1 Tax=Amphibacillus cookii TaxID=767787 RepID=UPI00195D76E4|nr:DUF4870 domain-containing protein [Amphibacillus cookii]MBM7541857.1 putative membrane protein [Amphibacillus cookii]
MEEAKAVDQNDVQQNKNIAMIAYLIFFIPLLAAKESKFARYHANQGLNLFIFAAIINILGRFMPVIGYFIIMPVGMLASLAFMIVGMLNANKGLQQPLPVIGQFEIIK